jgi:signal transduction histidine kinase
VASEPSDIVRPKCLLLLPLDKEFQVVRNALLQAAAAEGVQVIGASTAPVAALLSPEIAQSDLVVADVTRRSSRIFYEIGVAQATGKATIFLIEEGAGGTPPFDLIGGAFLPYSRSIDGLKQLIERFRGLLADFRSAPRKFRLVPAMVSRTEQPLLVSEDIERLGPREFENLCFELLTQMGFRRVEWGKELRDIDAVAILPRKDPDGFQYQELWLISMGLHAPVDMLLEMASDPDYLYHRFFRNPESSERAASVRSGAPLTLLLIPFPRGGASESIGRDVARVERRLRERPSRVLFRLRVWDTQQLIILLQQYPQLLYKYFSEQGRAQSKYRKSAEDMYRDNVALNERLQGTVAALKEEKDKRVRAERDAVWKELSFTAAHKLGNPIFALETDLQGLKTRIVEGRPDAVELAAEMRASLEKAKIIIEQFKSLTKAQEISPRPVDIAPLVKCATRIAEKSGVKVALKLSEKIPPTLADPGRMTECFDELVANAMHWFDKESKEITVLIERTKKKDLPDSLDRSRRYLRIRVEDNGCGVPIENKDKIFSPFFTTYHHGTGLGLSLVERIVEGHGGAIREVGKPGKGASFEIYLPIAERAATKE